MENTKVRTLDEVLNFLNHTTTWKDLRDKFPDEKIPKEELRIILRKLIRDKFVDRFSGLTLLRADDETGYVLDSKIQRNFEGDLFIEGGGYTQERKDKANIEILKNIQNKLLERQYWINVTIAIAAGVTAVYNLVELYWKYHWFH